MERAVTWHTVDTKQQQPQQPPMLFALSDPGMATSLSAQDTRSSARSSGWIARDPQDLLRASAGISSAPYAWADDSGSFSFATAQDEFIYGARPMSQSYGLRSPPMSSLGGPADTYNSMDMMLGQGMLATHGPMGNPMAVSAAACRSLPQSREIAIGRWTSEEHRWFLKGLEMFQGPAWGEIARLIGSRTSTQVRTHAQKFFTKLARQNQTLPHFEAQIRKERERLTAQGIAVSNSSSASSSTSIHAPSSLLARTSIGSDLGDGYNYTQSVTPTSTNAMLNLHAGGSGNGFALASLSPTAAKLSTLTKKRSHRDMLAMAMHDSVSPSSSSSSLDNSAFSGLVDYASQSQQSQLNLAAMTASSNKPRLSVDTTGPSLAGYPQQPSPLSWCGPLPSPIQHPQHQSQEAAPLDESLPSMTNMLRRRSVTAVVSPPSVAS